jgi:hypothetical protein
VGNKYRQDAKGSNTYAYSKKNNVKPKFWLIGPQFDFFCNWRKVSIAVPTQYCFILNGFGTERAFLHKSLQVL